MKKIGDLLGKFQALEHPDQKKEVLIKLIAEESSIVLSKEQLDIRNKTLFIKAGSAIKNEIFLRKEKLLAYFRVHSNLNIKIEDIR